MVIRQLMEVDCPNWDRMPDYFKIRAIVDIRFTCHDDYICDVVGTHVELEEMEIGKWKLFSVEEVCSMFECSRMKLGELFMEAASSLVYQAL